MATSLALCLLPSTSAAGDAASLLAAHDCKLTFFQNVVCQRDVPTRGSQAIRFRVGFRAWTAKIKSLDWHVELSSQQASELWEIADLFEAIAADRVYFDQAYLDQLRIARVKAQTQQAEEEVAAQQAQVPAPANEALDEVVVPKSTIRQITHRELFDQAITVMRRSGPDYADLEADRLTALVWISEGTFVELSVQRWRDGFRVVGVSFASPSFVGRAPFKASAVMGLLHRIEKQ